MAYLARQVSWKFHIYIQFLFLQIPSNERKPLNGGTLQQMLQRLVKVWCDDFKKVCCRFLTSLSLF